MRVRKYEQDELTFCARCGEEKQQNKFAKGDSYCKLCRRVYGREYHAQRTHEDATYLYDKAKKQRDKYRNNANLRVRRLESARKYRTRKRVEKRAKNQTTDKRWEDLT